MAADGGLYVCPSCGLKWADDLPPIWTGRDCWPSCPVCQTAAVLGAPLFSWDNLLRLAESYGGEDAC